jgi:putative membrane protein
VTWSVEALVVVPLLGAGYVLALRRYSAPPWRVACFGAALALLLAAFLTPLETIARHYLLSGHLLQNVVLAEWAPALLVLGLPPALITQSARGRIVHVPTHPLVALPTWLLTYFLWHLPWAYDTALEHSSTLLLAEHLCYLLAGTLLWWPVLQDVPRALAPGTRAAYVFAAFLLASPLGLMLALLPDPVYGFYEHGPGLWGLSPLADQQIAGLTMAAEQAVIFFAVFALFFFRFLSEEERDEAGLSRSGARRGRASPASHR